MEPGSATPLLDSLLPRTGSKLLTLGNIIVSLVDTGVLGLPFAFRNAGWLAGSLEVTIVGLTTYYCMLLLVSYVQREMSIRRIISGGKKVWGLGL